MKTIKVYDCNELKTIDVDIVFNCNMHLIYKCYRSIRSNQNRVRYGHYKSRRGLVGSNRKLRPQKGTGRARLGSFKSVQLKGGSVKFGFKNDKEKDIHKRFASFKKINRKEKQMCMKQLISNRILNGLVKIMNYSEFKKTKETQKAIDILGISRNKCILVHSNSNHMKPFNNTVFEIRHVDSFNCVDMINHQEYIFDKDSFKKINDNLKICNNLNF